MYFNVTEFTVGTSLTDVTIPHKTQFMFLCQFFDSLITTFQKICQNLKITVI